jgi:hypothetical protein
MTKGEAEVGSNAVWRIAKIAGAGTSVAMNAPEHTHFLRWQPACSEYLIRFSNGCYDEAAQLQLIVAIADVEFDEEKGDMAIGRPGSGGIYFCFRENQPGVFAYYPIENEYVLLADGVQDLVDGWRAGSISV